MYGRCLSAFAALLVIVCAAPPARAADPLPADAKMPADPAVQWGTLPNGLRYAVMPNRTPAAAVSIRLVINVGSYDESDSELGFAHFVEHMAFRSTKGAPGGVLDNRFAAFGVAMGQDQNAETSLVATVYRVDLPRNDATGIRQVLSWMRDAADGIAFTPAAVDAERGVVLAELRSRHSPLVEVQRATVLFQAPHLKSSHRYPGGTAPSLAAASPEALAAFHRRWYRPDNALLVIAGDIDAEQAKALAGEMFGGWTATGPRPERTPAPATFPERGPEGFTIAMPSAPLALSSCRVAPTDVARRPTLERLRRETLSALWTQILNHRLSRRSSTAGSPLIGAIVLSSRDSPDVRGTCLVVMPAGGKWKEALADAQAELRRFAAEGPTSTEVADAVSTIEAEVYAAWTEIRATPDLAGEIVEAEVGGRIFQSPEDRAASLELAVAGIDEKDVKDAFAHDWSGSGPLLTATGPDTLDKSALLAAWQDNEKAPGLEAYADREEIEWPYARFGKKGKLAAREVVPEGDFVRLRYRNGIVVNYKHTGFEAGAFDMRVSFGHGVRGLAAQDRQAAVLAAGLLPAGGLGKLDHEEITHALGTSTWAFEASPGSNAWQIATAGGVDALDQQMMVVSAFLSDPGFRPLIDEKIPTAFDWSYRAVRAEPAIVALDAMEQALFPEQKSFPPREQVVNLRAADLARLLKPALTGAPIEVAIVGDVDEKTVRRLVARTFGALPPRGPLAPPAGPAPFRRFPEILPAALTGYHEGPPEKAAALLVWPLWVAHRERRAEEHAITLATAIFRNRLLQQVRVATGKVYSPTVNASMPDNSDQGYLAAALDGSATDIGELTTAALAVAAELAAGKITQEEVDAARQPIVAHAASAFARNAAWASALGAAFRDPAAPADILGYKDEIAAVTLDGVRRAAATWLGRAPLIARALPAPAGAPSPR